MRFARLFAICIVAASFGSCASVPAADPTAQGSPAFATPLPTGAAPTKSPVTVSLLTADALKRAYGKAWMENPFLPWEKTLGGIQYQVAAIEILSTSNHALRVNRPEAFMPDGRAVGKVYDKQTFMDFWLDRVNDEMQGWERKRITIDRVVPYLESEIPLYANKPYVVPIIFPKDAPMPARYSVTVVVDGVPQTFELTP